MKTTSVFFPSSVLQTIWRNCESEPDMLEVRRRYVEDAAYWRRLPDDTLWRFMFGPTIRRSWMVWSSGFCPSCLNDVPMYNWVMDAVRHPWKTACPHCKEQFPKNDFFRYYCSGLDRQGIFDADRADRSLLYNIEHPDKDDPLHLFGVDDGEGYVDEAKGNRWRFIGAYLIYGQWKQLVIDGIVKLASAYTVTGDRTYARKAAILLDRVADVYPTFDFGKQGVMYEGPAYRGYVSTWHDACQETQDIALAYDQIVEAVRDDVELIRFLSVKAADAGLANKKDSFAQIQQNIENGILRDALANRDKVFSNYPRTEVCLSLIEAIIGWPENKPHIIQSFGEIVKQSTAIDGVTGEKGLASYSAGVIQTFAAFLSWYDRLDPSFLSTALQKHPQLKQTFRFFLDVWCLGGRYYPHVGDTGEFAKPNSAYVGAAMQTEYSLAPSMFTFFWRLYRLTGDVDYVRLIARCAEDAPDKLPFDLTAPDAERIRLEIGLILEEHGTGMKQSSINKEQWHLSILRSGMKDDERALWMQYDSGGAHGHHNGLTIGLFAKGLDLLPDFGYPPVHYGKGWEDPKAVWYRMSAAHNTVVIDGKNDRFGGAGKTSLWLDAACCKAIGVRGEDLTENTSRYDRTVALIDISESDCYVFDSFRVAGGSDHAKFVYAQAGEISTDGLTLTPDADYGFDALLREFRTDRAAAPGWNADWKIEDMHGVLPVGGADVHLRYTDLTTGASASTAEAWLNAGGFDKKRERWIPNVVVRKRSDGQCLTSHFLSVLEPYAGSSGLRSIRRLQLIAADGIAANDTDAAVAIALADGRNDFIISLEAGMVRDGGDETPSAFVHVNGEVIFFGGELCFIRLDAEGIERIVLGNAKQLRIGDRCEVVCFAPQVEIARVDGVLRVVLGEAIIEMK